MTHVAWYAHHHGSGHVARAAAVRPHLRSRSTLLTSAPVPDAPDVVRLPLDLPAAGEPVVPPPPPGLHHAPVHCAGLRTRMALLAERFADDPPDLLVVDVSTEVALLGRLCGVPIALVRQHGTREDLPHRLARSWAAGLLAPFPDWLEDPSTPESVRRATTYGPGFTSRPAARNVAVLPGRVVVLCGSGDDGFAADDVRAAQAACPGTSWVLAGPGHWHDDPSTLLAGAEVVVAHGGHNAIMEVAAAGRPLVCLPRRRPFGEQHGKARALHRAGAAVVLDRWPAPSAWPDVLDRARRLGAGRLARAVDPDGARRFAAHVDALASSAAARGGELGGGGRPQDLEALAALVP